MAHTWADIVADGGGDPGFRLVIEGLRDQYVTAGMATGALADGRRRIVALQREGLGFGEHTYLGGAEHDARINPVTLAPEQGPELSALDDIFSSIAHPVDVMTISLGSGAGATTATVRDSSLFSTSTWYYTGTETIKVTALPTGTTLTVVRGEWESTRQAHDIAFGDRPIVQPIYDHPPGFVGRRMWLYAHGSTELGLTDAGTIVWRGVVAKEPSEKEGAWTIQIESRKKLMEASLAAGFDKGFKLRGAYYPGESCFNIVVRRLTGVRLTDDVDVAVPIKLSGYFETNRSFGDALETLLNNNATISGWGVSFEVRDEGTGWGLYVRIGSATPRYVQVHFGSLIDGWFDGGLNDLPDAALRPDGFQVPAVTGDTMYRVTRRPDAAGLPFEEIGRIPRSENLQSWIAARDTDANVALYPINRLYLDHIGGLAVGDALLITPQFGVASSGTHAIPAEDEPAQVLRITSIDTTLGFVKLSPLDDPPRVIASGGAQPTIVGAATYANGDGDLEALRADVVARSVDLFGRGQSPFITNDDVASWASVVTEAAAGRSWLLHRVWSFSKAQRFLELLSEEAKLLGLFPYLDANAKLSLRPLTIDTRPAQHTVTSIKRIVTEGFGEIGGDDDGLVTTVKFSTGYNPDEDEHQGETYEVRDLPAIARVGGRDITMEIAPKSRAVGEEMGPSDAFDRAMPITTLFGRRRTQTVKFDVTLELFGVLVGDPVSITIPQLPGDGARTAWDPSAPGISNRAGIVVGRSWDLGELTGTLEVLLHELDVVGYTPSGKVASASGAGTAWTLTLTATWYSDTTDASHFAVGQAIRIIEWDAASPTIREGTVSSVSGNDVGVTLSAAWAGLGGAIYILTWDTSNDAETTDAQLASTFVAASNGRIVKVSGSTPSRHFAP